MHDAALLLARGIVGASIAAHGAQKLFGWFGGPGVSGASQFMGSLGFQPPDQMARLAALSEISAGVLIATGAGGPIGPMLLTATMGVAAGSVHLKNGFFNQNKGYELNAMYVLLALLLAVEDHGRYSLDDVTGIREKMHPSFGWLALAGGLAGAAYMLSRREQPALKMASEPPRKTASPTEIETLGAPASNITPATQ